MTLPPPPPVGLHNPGGQAAARVDWGSCVKIDPVLVRRREQVTRRKEARRKMVEKERQ